MSLYQDNPKYHLEPLPGDYDEQLKAVDVLLSRDAASRANPDGLAQRTYEASVAHLPAQRSLRFQRVVAAPRLPMVSRLSMAAAVLLAVAVGIVFLRSPGMSGINGAADHFAYNGYNVVTVVPASATISPRTAALSAEQEWLLLDAVQLSHFADVRRLSLADVNDDIAMLVRELEM
jgi:hypothetical protein